MTTAISKERLLRKLAQAERTLAHLNLLIEQGHLGWLTTFRLNRVCRKIERLNEELCR
jgi:hypothetical protein